MPEGFVFSERLIGVGFCCMLMNVDARAINSFLGFNSPKRANGFTDTYSAFD